MDLPVKIRILLLDDHPIVRSGIAAVVANESDMEVVGEAESALQATALFLEQRPDVALFDLMLPDGNGVDLVRKLHPLAPGARFIILTARSAVGDLDRARAAGVHGYLFKSARRAELLTAIRIVAMGGSYVSPAVESDAGAARIGSDLTTREIEVLRKIARGLANHQIAADLGIADETVKSHSKNILHKLGVQNRSEAAALCWKLGLMQDNEV